MVPADRAATIVDFAVKGDSVDIFIFPILLVLIYLISAIQ